MVLCVVLVCFYCCRVVVLVRFMSILSKSVVISVLRLWSLRDLVCFVVLYVVQGDVMYQCFFFLRNLILVLLVLVVVWLLLIWMFVSLMLGSSDLFFIIGVCKKKLMSLVMQVVRLIFLKRFVVWCLMCVLIFFWGVFELIVVLGLFFFELLMLCFVLSLVKDFCVVFVLVFFQKLMFMLIVIVREKVIIVCFDGVMVLMRLVQFFDLSVLIVVLKVFWGELVVRVVDVSSVSIVKVKVVQWCCVFMMCFLG